MDRKPLDGRVALITGAAAGIGAATASRFAEEGAAVVVVDRDEAAGRDVVAEISAAGGRAELFVADVGASEEIEAMIDFACRCFGRLDILHNNAVALQRGRVHEVELDNWRRALDVGLTAYWYATKVALGPMLAQGSGVIVNTASVAGLAGDQGMVAYDVAKAGVVNLTRCTALEYARSGIRCNALCPGPIATAALRDLGRRRSERLAALEESVPMGRLGEPREVAEVALFLASDASSYVTGACLVVDGGLLAHTGLPPVGGLGWDVASEP